MAGLQHRNCYHVNKLKYSLLGNLKHKNKSANNESFYSRSQFNDLYEEYFFF